MEEHGTQTILGVGLTLQRSLLEPVQGFVEVFRRLRVVVLAQFELRLGIPALAVCSQALRAFARSSG